MSRVRVLCSVTGPLFHLVLNLENGYGRGMANNRGKERTEPEHVGRVEEGRGGQGEEMGGGN